MDGDGGERKIRRWGVREGKEKEGERGRDVALVSATRATSIKKVDKEYVNCPADYYSAAAASCLFRESAARRTLGELFGRFTRRDVSRANPPIPPKTKIASQGTAAGDGGTPKRVAVQLLHRRSIRLPPPASPSNPSRTCPRR